MSRAVPCRQTDIRELNVAFCNFENADKIAYLNIKPHFKHWFLTYAYFLKFVFRSVLSNLFCYGKQRTTPFRKRIKLLICEMCVSCDFSLTKSIDL